MAAFSTAQQRELKKLLRRLPSGHNCTGAEEFLLRYIGFEAVSRKIWHYYRCRRKSKAESHAGIPITELKKAFLHFEIVVKDIVIDTLLNSSFDKRNSKSARNLRNAMVHSWKQLDCDEAARRIDDFKQSFIHVMVCVKAPIGK